MHGGKNGNAPIFGRDFKIDSGKEMSLESPVVEYVFGFRIPFLPLDSGSSGVVQALVHVAGLSMSPVLSVNRLNVVQSL